MGVPALDLTELRRDCGAIEVPDGNRIALRAGARVRITQQLGDTFTVMLDSGTLARIDGEDADALGLTPSSRRARLQQVADQPVSEAAVWQELRACYDPEIPCNIVELGLIYRCRIEPRDAGSHVSIEMTLTAPGCGMGQVLHDDVVRRVGAIPGVIGVDVALTFDPPWQPSMMSEAAQLQLGFM